MIKTTDRHGNKVEIEPKALDGYLRQVLIPITTNLGMTPDTLSKYAAADPQQLIGLIIGSIVEMQGRLSTARREYKKMSTKRWEDYQLILNFIKGFHAGPLPGELATTPDNVVNIKKRVA